MTGKLDWLKQIEWKQFLSGDLAEVADVIGEDAFLSLWSCFAKTTIYLSEKPLDLMRREYIAKHKESNVKELARTLNCSEMFVYNCRADNKLKDDQIQMFDGMENA